MGTYIITFCILAAFAVVGLGVWARFHPSTRPAEEVELEDEWNHAIR